MLETLWRDVVYSTRTLARRLRTTAVMLSTIALGIGATTAIFSVVNAVLIRPLPYAAPEALIGVWHSAVSQGTRFDFGLSASMYLTYRAENRTFEQLGVWRSGTANVAGIGEPEEVSTLTVTAEILPILSVQPALGRGFSARDDSVETPETIILTHGYWQRRLGGDPGVIGRTITVDSRPREIIGVLPESFSFLSLAPSLILPQRFDPAALPAASDFSHQAIARLKQGVTIDQANADIERMLPIWADTYVFDPRIFASAAIGANVHPLKTDVVGDIGSLLWVLMGTVGVVLLIACANVANLLLVGIAGRRQELAIRTALGAGHWRIARALLVESALLGLAGGTLGVALAYGALRILLKLAPANLPRLAEVSLDPVVLAFALAVSLLSGLLFGLIPVVKQARSALAAQLRGGHTGSYTRERRLSQDALVVVQVALALVILVGSGLMLRSFQELSNVEPGFTDPKRLQMVRVTIPNARAEAQDVTRIQNDMLERIVAIPGVETAAFTSAMPLEGSLSNNAVWVDGQTEEGQMPPLRRSKSVSPGVLATQGTPLLAGRDFTWDDVYDARRNVIVSARTAQEIWGGTPAEALGKRIRFGREDEWEEVIGVAADVHDEGVHLPASNTIYRHVGGRPGPNGTTLTQRAVTFAIRSGRAGTDSLLAELRAAIGAVAPDVPLAQVRTLDDLYERSMARTSFTLVMLGIAGSMALALGIVGLYGVIAYTVSERTREIAVRVAVGARNRDVTGLFVRHALVLTCIGVGVGLVAAAAVARTMSSLLFGVAAFDAPTYGAVVIVLVTACLLASYLPARRALAVDPVRALKAE